MLHTNANFKKSYSNSFANKTFSIMYNKLNNFFKYSNIFKYYFPPSHRNEFKEFTNEPGHEKMCLMSYANNKGADQPAHLRSLISAFVVRCLDSIIFLDSIAEISRT